MPEKQLLPRRLASIFALVAIIIMVGSQITPVFSGLVPPHLLSGTALAESSPTVSNAIVQDQQTGLTLPSGAPLYLYGFATGGAPASAFASGQYASVASVAGCTIAAIAVTTSDTNSFSYSGGYYNIGGAAVSGYSTYSASYGSDGSAAVASASDTFTVTAPGSLVVVLALAGGEQCQTLSGVPNLSIDATNNQEPGLPVVVTIAHAYPSTGTYTVTEQTTQCAAGQNPNNAGDLIGVFVFVPGTSSGPATGNGGGSASSGAIQTPRYAFNGASATYQIAYGYAGYTTNVGVSYTISNVDSAAQTFNVATTYSGYLSGLNQWAPSVSASFTNPSPFPAESESDLQMLNQGQVPPDMAGGTVTTGVSVSVPAGRFNTDEITIPNVNTIWVETTSGLIVKESGSFLSLASATMELQSTNIATAKSSPFIKIVIAVAVVLVLGVVIFLIFRRRKSKKSATAAGTILQPTTASGAPAAQVPKALDSNAISRLERLKELLDKGLITQQDYDEQKQKILGDTQRG